MSKIKTRLKKPEKIKNEQLNKIQNLISTANRAQAELGGMEVQKHRILHSVATIQDQITLFRDELKKEYGTDNIDIKTGKINYEKNEQANKKD